MATNLTVRPIARADYDQWRPLWDGYNAFYGRSGATAVLLEITNTTFDRFFRDDEPLFALVAERNRSIVGLAHYLFHRSTNMLEPKCYLEDLYTEEQSRSTGVGRALIAAVYEEAYRAGSTRVYWHTHNTNIRARLLYDTMADNSGFIVYRKDLK